MTAKTVAEELHIPTYFAVNDLTFTAAGEFASFISRGDEAAAKRQILENYCTTNNRSLTNCICLGDSTNDIPLFQATGHGVTFSWCKEEVRREAKWVIDDIRDFPLITKNF